jgi:RNA polymerase sigma-70 factor (ECF subfamily)
LRLAGAEAEFGRKIAAARRGDSTAIGELWADLHPRLVRFLWTLAGGSAEDLASDTWLLVARGLHRFEGGEDAFRAWVFTIARHRWVDWRRSLRRRPAEVVAPEALVGLPGPDDPAAEVEAAAGLQAAIRMVRSLPDDQAEVILLRVVAGLSLEDVARVVGKRPGNVRVLQHRGLRRLAERLNRGAISRLGKL